MTRSLIIVLTLLTSSCTLVNDSFIIKFGYLSVNQNTKEATVIEETNKIKYGSELPWGFTVEPKIKGTKFSIQTISKGTCESNENSGPYTTEGYYEISTWDSDSRPCMRDLKIYINDALVKTITYEVLNK